MISLSREQKSILFGIILGDGYLQKTGKKNARLRLEQGNVSKKEAEITAQVLLKKFNIMPRVKQKKKGYALYFSPKETQKLKNLIKNYILPYFNYKLPF